MLGYNHNLSKKPKERSQSDNDTRFMGRTVQFTSNNILMDLSDFAKNCAERPFLMMSLEPQTC